LKGSDYIAEFLIEMGCTHVFGYPGGAVTHLVDSFYRYEGLKFIGTYHEQAAAFAAEGYARMNNRIGVAIATSGPGATNLITGIGSAYFDSIPVLYLTGQVNTYEYKGNQKVRQLGFQETDIVSIVKPITKYAVRITDPNTIRYELEKAISTANAGRKGPVLVDIPMDVQHAEVNVQDMPTYIEKEQREQMIPIDTVIQRINNSKRPVFLVGGGVRLANATSVFHRVAARLQIPVVSSLMGRDAYDNAAENYIGMIGAYGNRYANLTIANSDLILALGTRLDTRQTGTRPETFAREATLIRVDIDQNELERKVKTDELSIRCDVKIFLEAVERRIEEIHIAAPEWLAKAKEYKATYPTYSQPSFSDPNFVMEKLSKCLKNDDVLCLDVGQNQMWAAQSLHLSGNARLLTSGGMGSMGFGLPCAVGAYYSGEHGNIIVITGDGGLQMNIQELELLKRNRIPIKIIIMNNHSLGMIRHFQEMYFEGRYSATVTGYEAPDFCKLAQAYGINNIKINNEDDFEKITEYLLAQEPAVIEIGLPQKTYVYPKLAVNRPIEDQEPLLSRDEFLKNMIIKPDDSGDA